MITDLLRNDLAKVSRPGSVKIIEKRSIQKLTSVIHTYSKISAKLNENVSPIEALISMFPGGSVTGCPKKRAMEIIDELEPISRSAYCGSMVCISPDGNLDSSILIRTIIKKGSRLVLPVGGGIVFDSNQENEYQETLDKAASIIDCLRQVSSGPVPQGPSH
jgi:para-aminobenzoate synthetase component 1